MPTLKQVTCAMLLGDFKVKEYKHRFTDGAVESYVAVPDTDEPFSLTVQSQGYIAPGLAAYVFIDGEYQANRNKIGLPSPHEANDPRELNVKFVFRQREERSFGGKLIARDWSLGKLKKNDSRKDSVGSNAELAKNVGTIEIIVLRCECSLTDEKPPSTQTFTSASDGRRIESQTAKVPRPQSMAHSKTSKHQSNVDPEADLGGLFGLFDGASDEAVHGEYSSRNRRRLPYRSYSGWYEASQESLVGSTGDRGTDSERHRPDSYSDRPYRSRPGHSRERRTEPTSETTYNQTCWKTREAQESQGSYKDHSGHTRAHIRQHVGPSSDELERLVLLHEQLRQSNTKAQEIIRSKELFARTSKDTASVRMQELNSQKMQELETQLLDVNAKRTADTDFIFECLADLSREELASAQSTLRRQNITLPALEEVQEWLRHQNSQTRASIRSEIEKRDQQENDGWQAIGEGVAMAAENQNDAEAGQRDGKEDQKSQGSSRNNQSRTSNLNKQETLWQQADQVDGNNNAWDSQSKGQPDAWKQDDPNEQRSNRWDGDGDRNKGQSMSRSTSTKVESSRHREKTWDDAKHKSHRHNDQDKRTCSGTTSKSSPRTSSRERSPASATMTEPRRTIKPYWSSGTRRDSDGHGKQRVNGYRDPYEYPALPIPTLPEGRAEGVSHGLHIGKGTPYVHKTVHPKYTDTMQNPYAVFVFHYRSKRELEKILGQSIDNEFQTMKERLNRENLLRFSKEDLVQKLLQSHDDNAKRSSSTSDGGVSSDVVTPEDSVSQIAAGTRHREATRKHRDREEKSKHYGKHGAKHRETDEIRHRDKDENKHRYKHESRRRDRDHTRSSSKSVKKEEERGWAEEPANEWVNNDDHHGRSQHAASHHRKSTKAPSTATHEHFGGEALPTTNGGDVAW